MENINKVERLNLKYIEFIGVLKNRKVVVDSKNKDNIIKIYKEVVNLRFNNISRVSKRVLRSELNKELIDILNSNKLNMGEFIKLNKEVLEVSKKNKSNENYMEIEV